MKFKGFTLAEAIVMIGVLGIITAVAIPTLVKKDFQTDTNIKAAAKAYSTLAQVVSNIAQDGYLYAQFDSEGFNDVSEGIDVLTGTKYNEDGTDDADTKFITIIRDFLYVKNPDGYMGALGVFDTPDGIRWRFNLDGEAFKDLATPMRVEIDTNIKNGVDFMCSRSFACKEVDGLLLLVYRNGNVVIDGLDSNATINFKRDNELYNDPEFSEKVLGQHMKTTDNSSYYSN